MRVRESYIYIYIYVCVCVCMSVSHPALGYIEMPLVSYHLYFFVTCNYIYYILITANNYCSAVCILPEVSLWIFFARDKASYTCCNLDCCMFPEKCSVDVSPGCICAARLDSLL